MIFAILFKRLVFSIIMLVLGVLVLKYTARILMWFGPQQDIERIFGGGGSVLMWKLIGIALVVAAILTITGTFSSVGL